MLYDLPLTFTETVDGSAKVHITTRIQLAIDVTGTEKRYWYLFHHFIFNFEL